MRKIKIYIWCLLHLNTFIKSGLRILRFEKCYRKELKSWAVKRAIQHESLRISRLIKKVKIYDDF